ALATVELDGAHLGHDPATCDPSRPSDRDRYPALWGVLVHEAAHARHSRWRAPGGVSAAHAEAATILEESRIEAAHLRRRHADRRWLRACATQLILADFTPHQPEHAGAGSTAPSSAPPAAPRAAMTRWDAARAAALLLARVDAGILDKDETAALAATVTGILGPIRLHFLGVLWRIAHRTADDDQQTMLDLGRRWCRYVGVDPDQPPPPPTGGDADSEDPTPLTDAITTTLAAVAAAESPPPPIAGPDKTRQRREEQHTRKRAKDAACKVFGTRADKIGTARKPTPGEQAAARSLARLLRAAAHRDRVATTTTAATPPGRLRMRGALAADAQRAAGAIPTAEPFTRITHRHVPAPPLRVGVACDVSGSMQTLAHPVASAAWIMARATGHVPDARAATVIFGDRVQPVTYPGHVPTRVRQFRAGGSEEEFIDAVDALDAALDLSRPGAARLLVVVSDGGFWPDQRQGGQQRITRLIGTGCAVLWLALGSRVNPMQGAHLVTLSDPAEAATVIGQAATRALRQA
ncbi:MAG TPA: vWA domain-containing protein, partial [Streptosporangiaceae bacterium]